MLPREIFKVCIAMAVIHENTRLKKNIKDVKGCRKKVCKQGRNDIIVKVNVQSLIPALFPH